MMLFEEYDDLLEPEHLEFLRGGKERGFYADDVEEILAAFDFIGMKDDVSITMTNDPNIGPQWVVKIGAIEYAELAALWDVLPRALVKFMEAKQGETTDATK